MLEIDKEPSLSLADNQVPLATMYFHRKEKLRQESSKTTTEVISIVGISGVVCSASNIPILEVVSGFSGTNYSHLNWVAFNLILFERHVSDTWFLYYKS